jgi:hypothetical protein
MRSVTNKAPAPVYLLADNLDSALAAGEDLLKARLTWHADDKCAPHELVAVRREERSAIEDLRTVETVLVARILKSRERAEDLTQLDSGFKAIVRLYNAGTAMLLDAVDEFGDASTLDFETGDGCMSYLRGRGLIAPDAAAPDAGSVLSVNEEFLITGRIPLGTLLDLVAMFLDALETHYDIYENPEQTGVPAHAGQTAVAEALAIT